jgi:enamine deaminase RidA (YjgF/YER057c/UK114 family)
MKGQAEQVYKNIEDILKGCGLTLANIAKTTVYLTDPSDIDAWREAQRKALGDIRPASTLLFISRLARPEFKIEVEVVAAKE